MATTTERILQSSGIAANIGSIQARELGVTSDTERPVIGTTVGGSKYIGTEEVSTIIVAAPSAFPILRRSRALCFVDTTTAGADVAVDIQAGAEIAGYEYKIIVSGPTTRQCVVTYGVGMIEYIPAGMACTFIWSGTQWYKIKDSWYTTVKQASNFIENYKLICSNAADTDHDITISAGSAMDSTGVTMLTLAAAITKQIDAAWAAGTNAGGLDTGTVASGTVYYIWIIRKDSDGTIDALFSLSKTAPTMPTGYTYKRRIMTVVTDASANIINFKQIGDKITFNTPILDRTEAALATTNRTAQATSIPPLVRGDFLIRLYSASGIYFWFDSEDMPDAAASSTRYDINMYVASGNTVAHLTKSIKTNSSRQIYLRISNATNAIAMFTYGWTDDRGQN